MSIAYISGEVVAVLVIFFASNTVYTVIDNMRRIIAANIAIKANAPNTIKIIHHLNFLGSFSII